MTKRNLYIIAGCNGAGKTTASFTILPDLLDCKEFVNADEIARGLSPFQPEKVSIEAGRIMLNRIRELLAAKENFAIETTLATKIYKSKIIDAQRRGYIVNLLFFWLESIDLAKERVKTRVRDGGHHIPDDIIERRYVNGIANLFKIYLPIADNVMIFNNSETDIELLAVKLLQKDLSIFNESKFFELQKLKDEKI
ncbi:MAG: zeta toxin family protein [Saprospiraceae bacterium]